MRKKLLLAALLIGVSALITTATVLAEEKTIDEIKQELKKPQPRIKIPGVSLTDPKDIEVVSEKGEQYLYLPFIGEYIAAVYRYAVVFITILAVITIIIAGIQWMLPAGEQTEQINKAKQAIGHALIGLLIVLFSYALLYNINPSLVEFKNLKILYIPAEIIDTEGDVESQLANAQGLRTDSVKRSECKLDKFPGYQAEDRKFGKESGRCLGWVQQALNNACTKIPAALSNAGAWDVAAAYSKVGKFKPCDLKGIQNGDIVFMTSLGSNWIGLWDNFRQGLNGCTIADAKTPDNATRLKDGNIIPYPTGVIGQPKDMPPVTHIGVYYQDKVYHLLRKVEADDATKIKNRKNVTRKKKNWEGISLNGNFIRNDGEFIAGYASME